MTPSIPELRALAERAYAANADDDISDHAAATIFADFGEAFAPDVILALLDRLQAVEQAARATVDALMHEQREHPGWQAAKEAGLMAGSMEQERDAMREQRDAAIKVLRECADVARGENHTALSASIHRVQALLSSAGER